MDEKNQKKQQEKKDKAKLIRSFAITIAILAVVGLTYAWYNQQTDITTLVNVASPSIISIRGAHGDSMTELNLSYTDDEKDGNTVTIHRVISVSSDEDKHYLEIAHTTNLKGLTFKLYKATESVGGNTEEIQENVSDSGYVYSYDENNSIVGGYLNLTPTNGGNYKEATKAYHSENYEEYNAVQAHAEPLYWRTTAAQNAVENKKNNNVTSKYLTYYVLEITWTETTKETDLFYVLAQNA